MNDTVDLYIINESVMVEFTTYEPDQNLDFSQWPYSYNFLKDLFSKEGFYPDRVVYEVSTGNLRKYAYVPTPDHRYILELGMTEKGIGDRPRIQFQEPLREIAFTNPNIISFSSFDTVGREIGMMKQNLRSAPPEVYKVVEQGRTIEVVDEKNDTIIRYLLVDLT